MDEFTKSLFYYLFMYGVGLGNAGASLLEQLTGIIALKIFLVGFVA